MKSISFKNFRRFADFPEFKFGDITILVGANNSGKSTLVKALLLVLDNLKTMRRDVHSSENGSIFQSVMNPEFRFDENTFHELNIKNFSRALTRHCDDDIMAFAFEVEHPLSNDLFKFEIVVGKYRQKDERADIYDDARGLIDFIGISNLTKDIRFDFCFPTFNVNMPYMRIRMVEESAKGRAEKVESLNQQLVELAQFIKDAEQRLNSDGSLDLELLHQLTAKRIELAKIEKFLKDIISTSDQFKDVDVMIPFSASLGQTSNYLLIDLVKDVIDYSEIQPSGDKRAKAYKVEKATKDLLKAHRSAIVDFSQDLRYLLDFFSIDYIQAHGVTQKTLFSTTDDNDHIAKTVKSFMQSRAWRNDDIREFIRLWMKEFTIGYDFKIKDDDGEAYKVFILESPEDDKGFPLADLGMGSIQLMMLLFALSTSIKHHIGSVFGKPTVVIEEPEQNLHPAVQSKLADLLFYINQKFGLKFLVETHSEYLIRRTQVLVAEMNLSEEELEKQTPFKLYYFPADGLPYDMKYTTNGHFEEAFGTGFFDEAGKWTRELTRNKRK